MGSRSPEQDKGDLGLKALWHLVSVFSPLVPSLSSPAPSRPLGPSYSLSGSLGWCLILDGTGQSLLMRGSPDHPIPAMCHSRYHMGLGLELFLDDVLVLRLTLSLP